ASPAAWCPCRGPCGAGSGLRSRRPGPARARCAGRGSWRAWSAHLRLGHGAAGGGGGVGLVAGLARLSLVVARTAQTQVLVRSGLVASEAAPLEALAVNPLTRLVVDVVVGLGPGVRVQLDGGAALGEEPH